VAADARPQTNWPDVSDLDFDGAGDGSDLRIADSHGIDAAWPDHCFDRPCVQPPVYAAWRDHDLPGADPNCEILASGPSSDFTNYYTTGTILEGVCNVRSYQKVTYKNIYPGIDLEFLQDSQNRFKYNFIVSPGGNLNAIRLHISGAETALLFSGSVVLKSKFGDITEEIPKSYTLTDGREKEIQIKFCKLTDEIYGFLASSTTPDHSSVIIDPLPNRLWATYYGGLDYDVGNDCKVDPNGFVYLTGETSSTHNIATSGAFQINFAGSSDAFLSKFDQDGQRQWGTYYGGSS